MKLYGGQPQSTTNTSSSTTVLIVLIFYLRDGHPVQDASHLMGRNIPPPVRVGEEVFLEVRIQMLEIGVVVVEFLSRNCTYTPLSRQA